MSSEITVYLVTAAMSIAIAFLLVYFTNLSTRARISADKKKRGEQPPHVSAVSDKPLKKVIYKELEGLTGSEERQEVITEIMSGIFEKELEKRVDHQVKDISGKYEKIIKEKTQNEEVVWKKYKKTLSDKEETEAVIRNIAEGLLVVDNKGRIVMMNPAAEKLLGVSKKDRIGKSVLDDIKEEQLFSLAKENHEEDKKEIELVSKHDETKKVLRASTAIIENEEGKTIGMVSVLSDVTKQKKLDELKSRFVANVSHELRTPLVAIGKSIDLIINKTAGELSKTQEELLTIADRNVKRLTFLINDLLDLSKLEAGKASIRRESVAIESIASECIKGLEPWAGTKSIRIEKDIEEGLPDVEADPDRITQVFHNLLGNSIKFTPTNGVIVVRIRLRKGDLQVQVSVADNGIGISKDDLPKVFDKFYQTGERVSTDISGTGIGLSITKEIVELHGGKIWVESEKGRGAEFIFTLPLKSSHKP